MNFYNWTDRAFTWMWGGVPYTTAPGEKMKMEEGMARIFAIHLGEREAERMKIVPVRVTDPFIAMANRALPDGGTVAPDLFTPNAAKTKEELMNEISSGEYENNEGRSIVQKPVGAAVDHEVDDELKVVKAEDFSEESLAKELLEENKNKLVKVFCGSCDSRGVTHKKDCPTRGNKVAAENAEFAGLKSNAPSK